MAGVLFRQVISEYTLTTAEKAISQLIAASNHGFYVNSVLLEFDDAGDSTTGVGQVTLRLHTNAGAGGVTNEPFVTGADGEAIEFQANFVPGLTTSKWTADVDFGIPAVSKRVRKIS